jgi:DNA mismatch repair protein MutS
MKFHSILFDQGRFPEGEVEQPDFFTDLNLDQVIDAIASRREEYHLRPFYCVALRNAETIHYRHEVMQDLEDQTLLAHIQEFADRMILARRHLARAEKLQHLYHREGWFLEAALAYCAAVTGLKRDLDQASVRSGGFLALRDYMQEYVNSPGFQFLQADVRKVKAGLLESRYCINIGIGRFTVQKYEGEGNYSEEVERTFAKFKQGDVKDYRSGFPYGTGMNPVEAKILELVARLYPQQFVELERFCADHSQFMDETICNFDREIQFYIAYLEFIGSIRQKGLKFCYPEVGTSREVYSHDGFDLALANSLAGTDKPVICNDFALHDPERILVVTGPNQGGKTTFARTFGQLHYLASLGLPVPGREARLLLFDSLFTHFERREDIRSLRGKLQDDLVRMHDITARATSDSILILNEIFESATLEDALFLSREIMKKVAGLDLLCVWVTFIDELASFNEKTVSMVSTVVSENPAVRTFKILRKPADGLAYAISIAEKHRLTYPRIKERIPS